MAQVLIRNVLQALYGNTPELRFFMRPDNRFAQHLIARQLLRHYVQIDNEIDQILPTRQALVRVAPDCNRSYCEDSFSGYSGSV